MRKIVLWKVIYTLCFVILCIINWIKVTLDGRLQMTAANLTGLVIALIVLSSYRIKDFLKKIYVIWLALCIVLIPIVSFFVLKSYPYKGMVITTGLDFAVCGFLVIRILHSAFIEKKSFR